MKKFRTVYRTVGTRIEQTLNEVYCIFNSKLFEKSIGTLSILGEYVQMLLKYYNSDIHINCWKLFVRSVRFLSNAEHFNNKFIAFTY